jgi:hypothetical protein
VTRSEAIGLWKMGVRLILFMDQFGGMMAALLAFSGFADRKWASMCGVHCIFGSNMDESEGWWICKEVAMGHESVVVGIPFLKKQGARNLLGRLGMGFFLCARFMFIFISLDPSNRNHQHGDSVLDIRSSSGEKTVSNGGESVKVFEFRSTNASSSRRFWSISRLRIMVPCAKWHFYFSCDPVKRTHHCSGCPLPVTTNC